MRGSIRRATTIVALAAVLGGCTFAHVGVLSADSLHGRDNGACDGFLATPP